MDFADHIVRLSKNKPQQHCKANPQSTSPPLFNNIVFKTQFKKNRNNLIVLIQNVFVFLKQLHPVMT